MNDNKNCLILVDLWKGLGRLITILLNPILAGFKHYNQIFYLDNLKKDIFW